MKTLHHIMLVLSALLALSCTKQWQSSTEEKVVEARIQGFSAYGVSDYGVALSVPVLEEMS